MSNSDHAGTQGRPRRHATGDSGTDRLAASTVGVLTLAVGIVLFVAQILPFVDGWVYPVVIGAVTIALLVFGRRAAARARTATARLWAGWAGLTASVVVFAAINLVGLGGALVSILLVVIVVNALIALWFRSGVHAAIVQWLGFGWAVVAYLYGVGPWAAIVLALAGLWWVGRIGMSRAVVASTTLLIPLTLALALHPVTHDGLAIDGGDIATAAGLTALALLIGAVIGRREQYASFWPTMRVTAIVFLVLQILLAGTPAVAAVFEPVDPLPSLLGALAAWFVAALVATAVPTRPGIASALTYPAVLWAVIASSVWFGGPWPTIIAAVALAVPLGCRLLAGAPCGILGGVSSDGRGVVLPTLGIALLVGFALVGTSAGVSVVIPVLIVVGVGLIIVVGRLTWT
ncbi:hypothetical protein SAMN06295974_2921 [Plantibacter flavus]|uniref:Uncharacterized protein n=1 Tax=Plantibacter flavus TaxID=150123 RepID=A0A3N2C5M1_9MICO|nr:hypothetical protein [Plantibacter flavus]ROR82823.1 hypothetical protein EDD42_2919 [Plantibacter flavus]SMG40430.1 hypothetical protein SAMN06295974_2921 [Plantibacter flavus]